MNTLITLLKQKSLTIAVAESCTGGNLSALLTSQSGSSAYFDRGFITYANQAKIDMLGVKPTTLDKFGAVSEQVALEMARGVIKNSSANISISITGIAGPTGGIKNKPVGMVYFGFCTLKRCFTSIKQFSGNRAEVVRASIDFVIKTLVYELSE
ncbi:CinA family protein [Candidatus Ruthia endofausta]|uniref:CinA family protein n=1 Tax=Candidatus Ruthia endofausta TaxID=2738852 RepID=A0A6N0HNR5_9GAMM|nr:CinA family protein [Candidatus Ruthia endofausta]QKQ23927.1 CinA family protein [Candidatus Ruthia endofausta]